MGGLIHKAVGSTSKAVAESGGKNIVKTDPYSMVPPVTTGAWQTFLRADSQPNLTKGVEHGGMPKWEGIPSEGHPSTLSDAIPQDDYVVEFGAPKDVELVRFLQEDWCKNLTEYKIPMVHPQKPYPVSIYADGDPDAADLGIAILRKPGRQLPTDHGEKKGAEREDGMIDQKDKNRVFNLSMTPEDVASYCENVDPADVERIRWYCQMPPETDKNCEWLGHWDQEFNPVRKRKKKKKDRR